MLKFFRKIRQNLIGKGDTKRYLFYAIGEIFLVVVGILIALGINNWNEERKQNLELQDYLFKIDHNMEQDIVIAKAHILKRDSLK